MLLIKVKENITVILFSHCGKERNINKRKIIV